MNRFTRPDLRLLLAMGTAVAALHVAGFALLFAGAQAPALTVGVGMLAYTLGLRHAFDADHIAAIDNVTRKLVDEHQRGGATGARPLSVGFWFSLGHSTIVFALVALLAFGVRAVVGPLADDASTLHTVTGVVGPAVSGTFLWVFGLINLAALISIASVFRRMRSHRYDEADLERMLQSRGVLAPVVRPLMSVVRAPRHIYPFGVLFGLGFDTATEVGLLVLAGGAAALTLPFWAILSLPLLFAAGMSLMDTLDGVMMTRAYGWGFARPVRKVYYNLTVTTLSVVVALVFGTIQLADVVADRFSLTSGPVAAIAALNVDYAGYVVVGLFAATWLVALTVWRVGRIEERWAV